MLEMTWSKRRPLFSFARLACLSFAMEGVEMSGAWHLVDILHVDKGRGVWNVALHEVRLDF